MEQGLKERLREVLVDLSPKDVHAIVAFAQFLYERRQAEHTTDEEVGLSEIEHARILSVLDEVAALSAETGPPVCNRDHDRHLYGES
jgi:hypothetical protein